MSLTPSFTAPTQQDINEVIDQIPDEGKLFTVQENGPGKTRMRSYDEKRVAQWIDGFFNGKTPPPADEKQAHITFGAPGSGKSYLNAKTNSSDSHTIDVSYDEYGAIFAIPDFRKELAGVLKEGEDIHTVLDEFRQGSVDTCPQRRALWRKYQPLSQYIRSRVLKRALREGYSVNVDTTSSSIGTQKLIEALRKTGYGYISMSGAFAPFAISRARIEGRLRPTSAVGDLVGKRIGAMDWMMRYARMVDRFDMDYNPSNDAALAPAFVYEKGHHIFVNRAVVSRMAEIVLSDAVQVEDYLKAAKTDPLLRNEKDVQDVDPVGMMQKYRTACVSLHMSLKSLSQRRVVSPNIL